MAFLLRTDGTTQEIFPEDGISFHLKELYKHLDCRTVEVAESSRPGHILIIDEEGKLGNKLPNTLATKVYKYPDYDVIFGDAILCLDKDFR